MPEDLEKRFDRAMLGIYKRAKDEAGHNATVFFRMLSERGGLQTARNLINAAKPSDGYTNLYERGRLELTVEAMIVESLDWQRLFTESEIRKARKRLKDYDYKSKGD
jgi:hypothetical protein